MDEFFEAPAMEESAKKSEVKPPCLWLLRLWLRPEFWISTSEYAVQILVEAAERPQLAPQDFFRNGEVVATQHIKVLVTRGRPNSRVTRCHFDHSNANRVFMSRSNRPYGFTCSQISGVSAA